MIKNSNSKIKNLSYVQKINFSKYKKIIFYIFIIIIIYIFWYNLYKNYNNILNYNFDINIFYIILSILIAFIYIISWWLLWGNLINKKEIKNKEIIKIHLISWLSRYIPWKIWIIASKIIFLKKYWVSKRESLIYSMYENIFQIITALIISIPIIIYYFLWQISNYYIYTSIFFIIWLIIFLYKPVFFSIINFWLKLFKKEPIKKEYFLNNNRIVKYIFYYSILNILNWLAFFLIIKGIINIDNFEFIKISGIWIFAWVIWLLALFAPSWIWVREWIIALLLSSILPTEIAILISIFSRLWISIIDSIIWLYILYNLKCS